MRSVIRVCSFALLAFPMACATAPKAAEASAQKVSPRDQVLSLLLARHQLPAKKQFEAASPEAPTILKAAAVDPSLPGFQRYAAYEALGYWPDNDVYNLYVKAIKAGEEEGQRHRVMRYLAQTFGERGFVPLAEILMDDPDPQMRITAATAMHDIPGPEARGALHEAMKREQSPVVREKIQALTQRPGGALR